jgi:hypothetical protein
MVWAMPPPSVGVARRPSFDRQGASVDTSWFDIKKQDSMAPVQRSGKAGQASPLKAVEFSVFGCHERWGIGA